MKTCRYCGEEIWECFAPSGASVWCHKNRNNARFCVVHLAMPAQPQPDPDGGTAEDDLIGQLAMMQDFIDSLRERVTRGEPVYLRDFIEWSEKSKPIDVEADGEGLGEVENLKEICRLHKQAGMSHTEIRTMASFKRLYEFDPDVARKFAANDFL